jgi:hypothetical protein
MESEIIGHSAQLTHEVSDERLVCGGAGVAVEA